MNKKKLDKHGCAICAMITKTGIYAGPVGILCESIKDVLSEDEFGEVVIHLATNGFATLRDGVFSLTEKGISTGKNFGASMELHQSTKKRLGKIEENLN